jgi:hypothetical protein
VGARRGHGDRLRRDVPLPHSARPLQSGALAHAPPPAPAPPPPPPRSYLYYAAKFLSTTAIGVAGVYVALSFTSFASKMAAACLLALFWQQCGWMAHDFAHHAVFANRTLNDLVGMLVGGFYLGFSLDWWKNKHNTHHAIPNVHESLPDTHDGDPDIDTLPFLAWSRRLARKVSDHARASARHGAAEVRSANRDAGGRV